MVFAEFCIQNTENASDLLLQEQIFSVLFGDFGYFFRSHAFDFSNFFYNVFQIAGIITFAPVGGVVTFPNAKKLVEVVEAIPIESILIETDCPYLAPAPNRGKRNDSSNLKYIVEKIAEIKGMTPEKVAEITKKNAENLFLK